MITLLVIILIASNSVSSKSLNESCLVSAKFCNDSLACLPIEAQSRQGRCSERGTEGQICEWSETCMNRLVCRPKDIYSASKFCLQMPKAGEPCINNYDCVEGGSRCISSSSIASSKVCEKKGILGEVCDTSEYCDKGLSCQTVENGYSICLPFSRKGLSCSSSEDCSFNLVCRADKLNSTSSDDRFCLEKEIKEAGQSCTTDDLCKSGLVCRQSIENPGVSTCRQPAELGEMCTNDSECNLFDKARACLKEDNHGVCKSRGNFGDSCDSRFSECYPQFTCRLVGKTSTSYGSKVCTLRGAKGESCSSKDDCAGALRCRFPDSTSKVLTCSDYGSIDQGCLETADCIGGLRCRKKLATDFFSLCLKPGEQGNACSSSGDCSLGLVCRKDGLSSNRICTNFGNVGENCDTNEHCSEGLYCSSSEESKNEKVCEAHKNAGEKCLETADCGTDLTCTPDTSFKFSTCSHAGKDGEMCFWKNATMELYSSCEEGLNCIPMQSKSNATQHRICRKRKSDLHEPCISSSHCAENLVCRMQKPNLQSTCLGKGNQGDLCSPYEQVCEEGLMCRKLLSVGISLCLPEGHEPVTCDESKQCPSNSFCHDNICINISALEVAEVKQPQNQ